MKDEAKTRARIAMRCQFGTSRGCHWSSRAGEGTLSGEIRFVQRTITATKGHGLRLARSVQDKE